MFIHLKEMASLLSKLSGNIFRGPAYFKKAMVALNLSSNAPRFFNKPLYILLLLDIFNFPLAESGMSLSIQDISRRIPATQTIMVDVYFMVDGGLKVGNDGGAGETTGGEHLKSSCLNYYGSLSSHKIRSWGCLKPIRHLMHVGHMNLSCSGTNIQAGALMCW